MWFHWVDNLNSLRLDVVGIVAVLGEGCTARTIEASSLAWHHVLPRLLPAPQALLRHQQTSRLGTEEGTVIAVYSGNHNSRLNHFCRLLHHKPLERNMVELVKVSRPNITDPSRAEAFGVDDFGYLAQLSILGSVLAIALLTASIVLKDGFAMVATVLLASTSTIVGYASKWRLELEIPKPQQDRGDDIPDSDLVIYYPTGAFRVVRCTEEIARLYFTSEVCKPYVGDDMYRFLALLASIFLMLGLLCMGNCTVQLQLAFAAAYIFLNVCYWAVSAINPMKYHWSHEYKVEIIEYHEPQKKHTEPIIMKPAKAGLGGIPKVIHAQQVTQEVRQDGVPTRLAFTFTSKSDHISDAHTSRALTDKAPMSPSPIRRRQWTDLEGFKQRIQPAQRALTAPIQRTFSGFFWSKPAPPENKEQRRFTQALWIAIALTGSGRWLKNSRIAPDTEVWRKWIDLAERRILSKRNTQRQLVPALTKVDGKIALPPWNYDGTLKALLQKEKETRKNRPPPPPTLTEILWDVEGPQGLVYLTVDVRVKLRRWARQAKSRIESGNTLPFLGLSASSRIQTRDESQIL